MIIVQKKKLTEFVLVLVLYKTPISRIRYIHCVRIFVCVRVCSILQAGRQAGKQEARYVYCTTLVEEIAGNKHGELLYWL